jgi:hypothetical protein
MSSVPEAVPLPGVYHSNNGTVELGGYEILRISDAFVRISQGGSLYREISSRYPIPYRTLTTVSGSIRRAFGNLYEFVLAMGFPANTDYFKVGAQYDNDTKLADLLNKAGEILTGAGKNILGYQGQALPDGRPANQYPIKTVCKFLVNKDKLLSGSGSFPNGVIDPDSDLIGATRYTHEVIAQGILIDTAQITVGTGGEIVTSGPIDFVGETYEWALVEEE